MLQWLRACDVCSKCFIYFFIHKLQVYLSGCCICFTHILQVFYLDIAYACIGFQVFFWCIASVSDVCCKCLLTCFERMLQVFHLDATKVDRVLHMLQCAFEAERARAVPICGLAARASHGAWARKMQPWTWDMLAQAWACSVGTCRKRKQHERLSGRAGAITTILFDSVFSKKT
jgi:hypothetical protein